MKRKIALLVGFLFLLVGYAFVRLLTNDPLSDLYALGPSRIVRSAKMDAPDKGHEIRNFYFDGPQATETSLDLLNQNLQHDKWRLRESSPDYALFADTNDDSDGHFVTWLRIDDIQVHCVIHEYWSLPKWRLKYLRLFRMVQPFKPFRLVGGRTTFYFPTMTRSKPTADDMLDDAAMRGDLPGARSALAKGAKVNSVECPLSTALTCDHLLVAQYLIDHGANINALSEIDGGIIVDGLARWASLDSIKFAFSHGAQIGKQSPALNDLACSDSLQDTYREDGMVDRPWIEDTHWLHSSEIAELYLEHGASPNAKDAGTGLTPLQAAALSGQANLVKLFLSYGADPTICDFAGQSARHLAAANKRNDWRKACELLDAAIAQRVSNKKKHGRLPF